MRYKTFSRIHILSAVVIGAAAILIFRLYWLQVAYGDVYREKAERQYVSPKEGTFDRGNILFSDKNDIISSIATVRNEYNLAVSPKIIKNPDKLFEDLSKYVSLDKEQFDEKLSKKDDLHEELLKRLDAGVAEKIKEADIDGVSIYENKYRFYPNNKIASQVVGFVGYKDDVLVGQYGLERYYEDILSRNTGKAYGNFFADTFKDLKSVVGIGDKLEGDIVTTLEPEVQKFLEARLFDIAEKFNPKISGGIVVNPKTGEIYAMAGNPSFDPNNFQTEKNVAVFSNPLVESIYEMGSIIKPLTVASGLDSGAITAKTTYNDEGFMIFEKDKAKISNFDGKGRGVVNMQEVLNQSLNTGVAFIVSKMGKENFAKYMFDFGLGEETGIDLPNEVSSMVKNLESPRDIEYATASFGQGIALTPINTVRALCALANEGVLVRPHLVKQINYKIGLSKEIQAEEVRKVIKKESAEEITRMLVNVVDKALLEGKVKMDRYSIAAKTGTAQIAKEEGGGYYDDRFLHSFFGYFPAYNPKFMIFFFALEPQNVSFASHSLTYPFIDTVKFLINYYNVPPDR